MKKKTSRLLWLMALPMMLGLASCAEHDNPVDQNPLAGQVSGLWWALADSEGSYSDGTDTFDYTRLGLALNFKDDGTGYAVVFFFDNLDANPIDNIGGEGIGLFTYTSTADGHIKLDLSNAGKASQDYFSRWALAYADGAVTATEGKTTLTLGHPTESMAAKIHEWDMQFNGGFEAEDYNINDYPIPYGSGTAEPFTADNWRQQGGIFLFVGGSGDQSIHDTYGRTGYQAVNLPWVTTGGTQSNLPMNFCNDITPENGWQLVMNNCGNRNIVNGNFFALYNKWTGVLRFFTYIVDFRSGNDHLWEVSVNGQTGMRQGLPYGLPIDANVVNPSAIGMDTNGSAHYVSPWVGTRSSDGLITPNVGWWAFDVDMSQYQPNLDISKDQIRLQMRSWRKENASFFSELEAKLNGTIDAEIKTELTKKASQLTSYNETMQIITSFGSVLGNVAGDNPGSAFTSLGSMVDHMTTLAGKNESKTTFKGSINMNMKGTITTNGIISGSDPVSLVASPTFGFNMFDTKNTQLGRGVWNLKTAPVIYLTNVSTKFELLGEYWQANNPDLFYEDIYGGHTMYYPKSTSFYFFDPSSIEVELNPDLFPSSEVEWTQVEAYCVSHAENSVKGTDNYRKAFGLKQRYDEHDFGFTRSNYIEGSRWQMDFSDLQNVFDFLHYSNDKWGLEYPAVVSTPKYEGGEFGFGRKANGYYDAVVGRGKAGSVALEPMVLQDDRNKEEVGHRIPALEVMVCLTVKVKGQSEPFVYVRNFLPEILLLYTNQRYDNNRREWVDPIEMNQVWRNILSHQPKGSGVNRRSATYDYEMERIGKILEFLNSSFKADVLTDYVAKDGETLSGTFSKNMKVSIADGATVTLNNVTIDGTNDSDHKWAGITCEGNATIILKGTNTVKGSYAWYPGIHIAPGKTLTIKGDGSLTATNNGYAAGIGGGYLMSCGNIVIEGGTINAISGGHGAGIGSGRDASCGDITITGGTINATGGEYSAGIGGGTVGSCGNITITNGVTSVTATKGSDAPYSIGAGYGRYATVGTVTIGGTVTGNISTSPYTYKP